MDISDVSATRDSGSQQSPEFKKTKLSQSAGSELPAASCEFPLAISDTVHLCFKCYSLDPSTLSFPHCVHKPVLCFSIPALQVGSSVPPF